MSTNLLVRKPAVLGHAVAHPVVRGHVVDVVTAVKIIEPLRGGQIFSVIAEIPFSYARRRIARRLQHLRQSDLVPEYSVHVIIELERIDEMRDRIRSGIYGRGEYDVIEVSARRITPREYRKSGGRTNGTRGVKVIHHYAVVCDTVDIGRINCRISGTQITV